MCPAPHRLAAHARRAEANPVGVAAITDEAGATFQIAQGAKGDWSAAQSKADDMKRKQMDLRKLAPDEFLLMTS